MDKADESPKNKCVIALSGHTGPHEVVIAPHGVDREMNLEVKVPIPDTAKKTKEKMDVRGN